MTLFFLLFFSVYGGMHAYFWWHVARAFPNLGWWHAPLIAVLLFLLLSPVALRYLERSASDALLNALTPVCWSWTAILFWFVVLFAAADLWNLALRPVALVAPAARSLALTPRVVLAAASLLVVFAFVWGLVEAQNVGVSRITIRSPRLPAGAAPIRIAQLSDLHIALPSHSARLARIVRLVQAEQPDLVVSTGDLVDSGGLHVAALASLLADLRPALGKFAVTGNHESYAGLRPALEFHRDAGFRMLANERIDVGDHLLLVGVPDPGGMRDSTPPASNEPDLLRPEPGRAVVLLKHRPIVERDSVGLFDLQLSGHIHGGQIFPFGLIVRLFEPYGVGLHDLSRGSILYVTRGAGTWGPPLRFLAPPEITLVTILPAS